VSTVTTNVPGPRPPLFVAGRRLLEIYPYVPIAFDVRIGVAILTYDGVVTFGVTADERSTPDLDVLVHGIDEGMRELIKIAEAAGPAAPAHPSK
jgi:diacylglycerol O-acyltransferase